MAPILIFQARAEARAMLLREGLFRDREEAIEPLRDYARRNGLVELIGAEAVLAIINAAFGANDATDDE